MPVVGGDTLGDFFHTEVVPGYEPSLLRVYLVWATAIAATYPLCAWYATYKRAHRDNRWLSYL